MREQFVKLIVIDNYGAGTTTIATFNIISLGNFDNVATLTATNNVALAESPSLLINGGRIIDSSDTLGGTAPNIILQYPNIILRYADNGGGWQADVNNNAFAVIELAGGKVYTIEGVRLSGLVKDFEVWASSSSTDATAFTRVLSATQTGITVVSKFMFPGGPVKARYVKYVPKSGLGQVFPSDLSGSTIVADKPITVYGGHRGANIPGSQPFANPIFEQLLPVPSWSRSVAVMVSAGRTADTLRAIAKADTT